MKNLVVAALLAIFLPARVCFAQTDKPPDPYKSILDRLEALQTVALPEWRYHEDLAHHEDPTSNDADVPEQAEPGGFTQPPGPKCPPGRNIVCAAARSGVSRW